MNDIEKVIEDLESIKKLGASGSPAHIKIDNAIQTIRELQEQIPKWHLVSENDLPSEKESLNSKLCWDEYRKRCVFARYVDDRWILGNGDEPIKVIAWMEIPVFSEKFDNRPQCCIDHNKYYSVCDTCEFGESEE